MADSPGQTRLQRLLRIALTLLPVFFFLALRLAILDTALDRLGHLGEGELAHADLAADLLEHRPLRSLWDYQVVNFHGGTLISSLLYVPWSRIFGLSYASLKGLALAYGLVAMLAWMRLLTLWRGRATAAIFGWLYACAPPVLTRMQLTLWGTHAELNAVLALCLLLAYRWDTTLPDTAQASALRMRRLFVTGLVAGLAIYFNFSAAVFVGLLGAVVLFRGAGLERLMFPVGVVSGLIPLAVSLVAGRGQLEVYGQTPVGLLDGAISRLPQLPSLMLRVPPFSPQMPPTMPITLFGALVHLALYGAAAAILAEAFRSARSRSAAVLTPALLVGAYPFLFLLAFTAVHLPFTTSTAGTFGFCPRYAATLYPFLMGALACLAGDGFHRMPQGKRGGLRKIASIVAVIVSAAITVSGLSEDLLLVDPTTPHMAERFDPIPLTRQGIWSVDRRSMEGVHRFLELEAAHRISDETARGVRAVIGNAFDTDYWRFLERPPVGPDLKMLDARVQEAMSQSSGGDYRAGVAWGRGIALGQPVPGDQRRGE